jgi:hypothetical protein
MPNDTRASTAGRTARGLDRQRLVAGFSVADLCRRWRCGGNKIRAFLRRGELIGVNVATNLSGRPQWRVTEESVLAFEARRTSAPAPRPAKRKKKITAVDYYP